MIVPYLKLSLTANEAKAWGWLNENFVKNKQNNNHPHKTTLFTLNNQGFEDNRLSVDMCVFFISALSSMTVIKDNRITQADSLTYK